MSAIISKCQKYRYRLDREIVSEPKKVMAFFGINPSTADASIDDNTLKRLKAIAAENGASALIVGNVFAYRTPNVKELKAIDDPIGFDNAKYLKGIINEADVLVPFWGSKNKLPAKLRPHLAELLDLLMKSDKPIMALGLTTTNDPRHTQGVKSGTPLTPWSELIKNKKLTRRT